MYYMLGIAAVSLFLGACTSVQSQTTVKAMAVLMDAKGRQVGKAWLTQSQGEVRIRVELDGVPGGVHAFHVHDKGLCEPPFETAGPHFNPDGKKHGLLHPAGAHAGDLPNVVVSSKGTAMLDLRAPYLSLKGEGGVLDEDGASIIIHEKPDDGMTDPAGAAGRRIVCGVLKEEKP